VAVGVNQAVAAHLDFCQTVHVVVCEGLLHVVLDIC
jgi:hypothetical protein